MNVFVKIPAVFLMVISCCQVSYADSSPEMIAQQVLDKLYKAHGNFRAQKPRLSYKTSNENVARYLKYNNTIELEDQAYKLCRSFGKDSLDALAFILGHELIHATQLNNTLPKTSFISYDKSLKSTLEIEQNADIQGIFVSHLAGYNTLRIIPELISKMYSVYGLRNKEIKGYPTEEERKSSYKPVIEQASALIELFKLSNEFSIIEEYEISIQCLEYITRYYQGQEVYNNLGVNYALRGLNFTVQNSEGFIYPLELEWNSRIRKPKSGRGEEDLDPLIKIQQLQMFTKAKDYFTLASQLDPGYALPELNLFCVLIIMNDFKNAKDYYTRELRTRNIAKISGNYNFKIKSAYAILLAKMNNIAEAKTIFQSLETSKDPILSTQAQQNLGFLEKGKYNWKNHVDDHCNLADLSDISELQVKLRNVNTKEWIQLDSTYRIEKHIAGNTRFYTHYTEDYKTFTLQKTDLLEKRNLKFKPVPVHSLGNHLWIYHCKKEKAAFLLNEQLELTSIIRYYQFREHFE